MCSALDREVTWRRPARPWPACSSVPSDRRTVPEPHPSQHRAEPLLQAALLVLVLDEPCPARRRQEPDDVHHVEVRLRLPPGALDVRRREPVRDLAAMADREVGAAVGDVQPGRADRGLHPVDHARDLPTGPEHVAGLEVAVDEAGQVGRRVAAEQGERLLPHRGVLRPRWHGVFRLPGPGLVGADFDGRRDVVDGREQVGQSAERARVDAVEVDAAGQQGHQVSRMPAGAAGGVEREGPG